MGLPPYQVGTRKTATQSLATAMMSSSITRSSQQDPGMSKRVVASCTFVNGATKQVQAANGTFAAFQVADQLLIEGVSLNNGIFKVLAIDGVNQSFLTLSPSPKNEGPITATIRTV